MKNIFEIALNCILDCRDISNSNNRCSDCNSKDYCPVIFDLKVVDELSSEEIRRKVYKINGLLERLKNDKE